MSGFVCQPTVVPAGVPSAEAAIDNDGFFPAIDPASLRKQARIADSVLFDRLREAVLAAMLALELDLRVWKGNRFAEGYATLGDVPSITIGGESRLVALYRRGLVALVRAELIERSRDLDTTSAGDRKVDALDTSLSDLRRDAAYAVRDLLGRARVSSELI